MTRLLFLLFLILSGCGNPATTSAESAPPVTIPKDLANAALVFERDGAIYLLHPLKGGTPTRLIEGSRPRWSPDGTWIAFLKGHQVCRFFPGSDNIQMLSPTQSPRALAVPPSGTTVWYTDHDTVREVDLETTQSRIIHEGVMFLELDAAPNALVGTKKVLGGYRVVQTGLPSLQTTDYGKGCSASISPDGSRVTKNTGDHTRLAILNATTGKEIKHLPAPPGRKTDNQLWSNHSDWVVSMDEESGHIYAHRVSSGDVFRITRTGGGDRPDLFVPSR